MKILTKGPPSVKSLLITTAGSFFIAVLLVSLVLNVQNISFFNAPLGTFAQAAPCQNTTTIEVGTASDNETLFAFNVEGYAIVDATTHNYCGGIRIDSHLHINYAGFGGGSWRVTLMPHYDASGHNCALNQCSFNNLTWYWTSGVLPIQSNVAREYGDESNWELPPFLWNTGYANLCDLVYTAVWSPPTNEWHRTQILFAGECPGNRGDNQ